MDESGLVPGPARSLGLGGQLLQQRVGLALGRFHTVGPHDAGGPVEVEHHHQLLPLLAELLDLGLELRVDHLQPLRLLHRDTDSALWSERQQPSAQSWERRRNSRCGALPVH